jgi:multisubunit Na+/H+ antiporter MnhG subunit
MDKPLTKTEVLTVVLTLVAVLVWLAAGVGCCVWMVREPGAVLMLLMWACMTAGAWMEANPR